MSTGLEEIVNQVLGPPKTKREAITRQRLARVTQACWHLRAARSLSRGADATTALETVRKAVKSTDRKHRQLSRKSRADRKITKD